MIICSLHRNSWDRLDILILMSSLHQHRCWAEKTPDKTRQPLVITHILSITLPPSTYSQGECDEELFGCRENSVELRCSIRRWTPYEPLCSLPRVLHLFLSPLLTFSYKQWGKKVSAGKSVTFHTTCRIWDTEQRQDWLLSSALIMTSTHTQTARAQKTEKRKHILHRSHTDLH